MRKREIIEKDQTHHFGYTDAEEATIKSLEVLLDIRDLLMPQITREERNLPLIKT